LQGTLMKKRYPRNGDMLQYVSEFESLFDQLENMNEKIGESMRVAILFNSLSEAKEYEGVITALRTISEEMTWEKATTRLIEEWERKDSSRKTEKPETKAFYAQTKKSKTLKCWNCDKKGHIAANCRSKKAKSDSDDDPDTDGKRDPKKGRKMQKNSENSEKPRAAVVISAFAGESWHDSGGEESFIVDSGATWHMCKDKDLFHDIRPIPERDVVLGNNSTSACKEYGSIDIVLEDISRDGSPGVWIRLQKVLYVPELATNLISCNALSKQDIEVSFGREGCELLDKRSSLSKLGFGRKRADGLYQLAATSIGKSPRELCNTAVGVDNEAKAGPGLDLWHRRLGHVNKQSIKDMVRSKKVTGVTLSDGAESVDCEDCAAGKQTRKPFKGSINTARSVGDVIHTDVCGPLDVPSLGGNRYFVSFVDEYTRYVNVGLIERKRQVVDEFRRFQLRFEREFKCKIQRVHCDRGGEYVALKAYLENRGIKIEMAAAYCPEANGIAERLNRTLGERVRAMLENASLSKPFWGEALNYAVYIFNRTTTKTKEFIGTPYERLNGRVPDLSNIRIFGCRAYSHVPAQKRTKLDARSWHGVFIGCDGFDNYRIWNPKTDSVEIVRNVRFDETTFPGDKTSVDETDTGGYSTESSSIPDEIDYQIPEKPPRSAEDTVSSSEPDEGQENPPIDSGEDSESAPENHEERPDPEQEEAVDVEEVEPTQGRYPSRERRPPRWLSWGARLRHPDTDNPTLSEAMTSPQREEWTAAIQEELTSLEDMHTWDLVDLPQGARALPNKFVLKIKRHENGLVERYKARLVILGNLQAAGIDFDDTFAPVVDFAVVRLMFAVAAKEGMHIHQMDVKTAFLNGDMHRDVYMMQPKGFEQAGAKNKVCKLRKSLYGLRQAPRAWYHRLESDLRTAGFEENKSVPCLFSYGNGEKKAYLMAYVDDICIISKDLDSVKNVKKTLSSLYDVKDLGEAKYFLGVGVRRDENGCVHLTQEEYIRRICERFGMSDDCQPISTPVDAGQLSELRKKTTRSQSEIDQMSKTPYREAVGALQYLATRTRPDICVAVGILSQRVVEPRPCHWEAVKRVLKYLKCTSDMHLVLSNRGNIKLDAYADADYGTSADRKSLSGYVIRIGETAINWKSAKQQSIALSTAEAEYMSLAEAVKEVVWIRKGLEQLGWKQEDPTVIYQDNNACISWANESVFSKRSKHIDIRYHFTREKVTSGEITLRFVPSTEMVADILTKPLHGSAFQKGREQLGIVRVGDVGNGDEHHIV
jgi:transposase InsO family protein